MKFNSHHRTSSSQNSRTGVTLVEVAVSTLLVGLLMVASLSSVGNIGKTWVSANQQTDGQELAQQLMREILAQYYIDPAATGKSFGREGSESKRDQFNDIDDYDGWTESPVKDAAGNALTGYTGWTRSVVVEQLHTDYTPIPSAAIDKGIRRVTVTVTSPSSRTTTLVAYRTAAAGSLQTLSADTTTVTWAGVTLKIGTNSPTSGGTCVNNHAEDQ